MQGGHGKRPGRAWLLGAGGLVLVWSLVGGLGGGGEIMPVRDQAYDTAFNPSKELAMERAQEAAIREAVEKTIAMADARDASLCDSMVTERMSDRMDRMMSDRQITEAERQMNRRMPADMDACAHSMSNHPPIGDVRFEEIDVLATSARAEFSAMVRGGDKRWFRALLLLDRDGRWLIDRIGPRRR